MFSKPNTSANMVQSNLLFIVKGRFSLAQGVNVIMPESLSVIPLVVWGMLFTRIYYPHHNAFPQRPHTAIL